MFNCSVCKNYISSHKWKIEYYRDMQRQWLYRCSLTENEISPLGNPRCSETYVWTRPCAHQNNYENNFRPISVISHIDKVVERLVSTQVVDYLKFHKFISIDQFAYLKRPSAQTSLHGAFDNWLEQINDNSLTGAFVIDSINHELLFKKWVL